MDLKQGRRIIRMKELILWVRRELTRMRKLLFLERALLQREMMRMRCQIPVKKCCHLLLEMKWTKVRKMKKILVTEQ